MTHPSRRSVLKGLGAVVAGAALGPQIVSAEPVADRFIVNTAAANPNAFRRNASLRVVHDFHDEIGVMVVTGPGRSMKKAGRRKGVQYAQDLRIERAIPLSKAGPTVEDEMSGDELFTDLQWDKQSLGVYAAHAAGYTGAGARIGIIDDGVLGASSQFKTSHPDLPNINKALSTSFVPAPQDGGDNFGAGPLADDHGTHVAGIAAASGDLGVVGVAPDAEIVDIRVFSGPSATFGDIIAAVIYGSLPEANGGAACDVLNLSLGTAPLLPFVGNPPANLPAGVFPVPAEDLAVLVAAVSDAGDFANANETVVVASAGNDSFDLDRDLGGFVGDIPVGDRTISFDGSAESLPNDASGFMSVAATGPIGYLWAADGSDDGTELPATEPAFYTNYGSGGEGGSISVSAPGGNADLDAIGTPLAWFNDLVFSTTIDFPPANANGIPENTQLGNRARPSWGWKAGTSMAAPQVAGFAALLAAADPSLSALEIQGFIESTATQIDIGLETTADGGAPDLDGETTAPYALYGDSTLANVAADGAFDGDDASNPDSVDLDAADFDSENFRGYGHMNIGAALDALDD